MTNIEAPTPTPVAEGQRIEGLDVLRGVALLGILAMNIQSFSMPFSAYMNPTVFPEFNLTNQLVYIYTHVVYDVKMMTLFSMLFGAGAVLYWKKCKRREDVWRIGGLWFRRMGWLLLLGMIHAYFIWYGDILVTYAVCGLLALWWLRRVPPTGQLIIGGALILFAAALNTLFNAQYWIYANPEMMEAWGWPEEARAQFMKGIGEGVAFFDPTPEQFQTQIDEHLTGYIEMLPHRLKQSVLMQAIFIPLYMLWRCTGAMLLGMALFKMDVLTGRRSTSFYLKLAVIGYAIGIGLTVAGIIYNTSNDFDIGLFPMIGMRFNEFGSVPMALGHVGLVFLLFKSGVLGRLAHALAAVGRMALTNYLMQSVVATLLFYGYGFALFGKLERLEQQGVVVAIWAFQLIFSVFWLKAFRFGPAEWLWRSLTYWSPQPMRRVKPTPAATDES
ncbi:MAG: DUF418 domain-containing protein [Phycisphaerales bacterium]